VHTLPPPAASEAELLKIRAISSSSLSREAAAALGAAWRVSGGGRAAAWGVVQVGRLSCLREEEVNNDRLPTRVEKTRHMVKSTRPAARALHPPDASSLPTAPPADRSMAVRDDAWPKYCEDGSRAGWQGSGDVGRTA
jgi:hypothetical protein